MDISDVLVDVTLDADAIIAEDFANVDAYTELGRVHVGTDYGEPGYGLADFVMGIFAAMGDAGEPYGVPASELADHIYDQFEENRQDEKNEAADAEGPENEDDDAPPPEEDPAGPDNEDDDADEPEPDTKNDDEVEPKPDEDSEEEEEVTIWVPPAERGDIIAQTFETVFYDYGFELAFVIAVEELLVLDGALTR